MTDAYKKISPEIIEITSTHIYQRDKAFLLEQLVHCQEEIKRLKQEEEQLNFLLGLLVEGIK